MRSLPKVGICRNSRREWLGKLANFKGAGYCLDFEVGTGCHVTYTVHCYRKCKYQCFKAQFGSFVLMVTIIGFLCFLKSLS